ncbi:hypothetical protein LPU83_pLPU83d_0417 (plasmid) [Rhizobium favelukesii]|uniref:DDE domain-containing protein n=1 Tax=Rhizobium favelukesii TaxID=348824 RepID=W6RSL0_9HYPH|nr:hypothetical protein LPU83_pLPU83d_0417 [Rhizobium favelukesii]
MTETMLAALTNIRTAEDMIMAFFAMKSNVGGCWKAWCGRVGEFALPVVKRSIAIAGRDTGKRHARPGLYQCSSGDCRFQFTVTTHTPLHSTKLPLRVWLKGMWLMLQSDKGLSSVRLVRGEKHWLWRAVDQDGFVIDVLVQSRRNAKAAKRLMRYAGHRASVTQGA